MDKSEKKAEYLVFLMGDNLALRFVNACIAHWESEEFISVRTETKEFWEMVKANLSKFTNLIIRY